MNKKENVVSCKFEANLSGNSKQIIQVFPKKTVFIEKYNKKIDLNDKLFDEMINNFNNDKLFKPFGDENHSLGIKFFDILNLFKTETGLFAEIELNEIGKDAIKNKKYSYISPEWGTRTDTDGKKYNNVLWAITLTNIPALEGENPTLQEQIKLSKKETEKMEDLKKRLSALESKFSNYRLQAPAEGAPSIDPAIITEVMSVLQELMAKLQEATDQKEVAEKQAQDNQEALTKLQKETNEKEKEEFFKLAITNGQIDPKEQDILKAQFDKSPDFIKQLVSLRPVKKDTILTSSTMTETLTLDPEEDALRIKLGYSVEDWNKYTRGK